MFSHDIGMIIFYVIMTRLFSYFLIIAALFPSSSADGEAVEVLHHAFLQNKLILSAVARGQLSASAMSV